MKRIINGRRYDTDKAIEIGHSSYNGSRSDFQWWSASLYKTPRAGRYFLAGQGNGMSRFATRHPGGGFSEGEGIVEMTPEDALAWAEQELGTEVVEEHFADAIEDA